MVQVFSFQPDGIATETSHLQAVGALSDFDFAQAFTICLWFKLAYHNTVGTSISTILSASLTNSNNYLYLGKPAYY